MNMPSKKLTYEEAFRQLENIVKQVEEGTMPLDELSEKLKEAHTLLETCRNKLRKTEEEVKKLLENEPENE